jgi:hypothetical protein
MNFSDYSQEEIEEEIKVNLIKNESCEEIEPNSQEIYLFEDVYESLSNKNSILTNLKFQDLCVNLEKQNSVKFNKLKLLLYQKFLRIIISLIVVNLRKNLAIFFKKIKAYKFKILGYNFETTNKVKLNLILRNINLLNFMLNQC